MRAFMVDDILTNKAAAIEHSIRRIREEYADDERNLFDDVTRQDSIILNLQRACQSAIDLAMHLVQVHDLGVPQESRDAFTFLIDEGMLDRALGGRLKRMVGFRKVAIHEYQQLELEIVNSIVKDRLGDLKLFTQLALSTRGFREDPGSQKSDL